MNYPQRWVLFWAIVCAIGVGLGLMQWRWSTLAIAFAATTVAMTSFMLAAPQVRGSAGQRSALTWRVVGTAAGTAAAMVAFVAAAYLSVALALCLFAAAVMSSPWMVSRLRRRGRAKGSGATYTEPAFQGPPHEPAASTSLPKVDVERMSTAALCHAWRRSFTLLDSTSSIVERSRIVGTRQLYLDELERRSPNGLRAWLDSGARAAASPLRYVVDDSRGSPDA